jgi:hypothetical protein
MAKKSERTRHLAYDLVGRQDLQGFPWPTQKAAGYERKRMTVAVAS